MDPLIARAFLTLLLSPARREQLKAYELTLPPGRYAQGHEICRWYRLDVDPVSEDREAVMKGHFAVWERENWKRNQIEDKGRCLGVRCHGGPDDTYGWCKCRTYQQEIHDWMDYIVKHWTEPLPKAGGKLSQKITFQELGID